MTRPFDRMRVAKISPTDNAIMEKIIRATIETTSPNVSVTDDDIKDMLDLCKGIIGTASVVARLFANDEHALVALRKQNIKGSDIWILYKDACHEDIEWVARTLNDDGEVARIMLEAEPRWSGTR